VFDGGAVCVPARLSRPAAAAPAAFAPLPHCPPAPTPHLARRDPWRPRAATCTCRGGGVSLPTTVPHTRGQGDRGGPWTACCAVELPWHTFQVDAPTRRALFAAPCALASVLPPPSPPAIVLFLVSLTPPPTLPFLAHASAHVRTPPSVPVDLMPSSPPNRARRYRMCAFRSLPTPPGPTMSGVCGDGESIFPRPLTCPGRNAAASAPETLSNRYVWSLPCVLFGVLDEGISREEGGGGGSARALSCDTTLLLNSTSCHPSQNNARGHSRFKRLSEAANDSTLQRPLACGGGPPLVVWDNDSLLWCDTAPCPFLTGAVGGDGASARRLFCVRKWLEHAPPPPS
jgi:hypothetical protein